MCLAHHNQHHQSHFLGSRVASSSELILSNCGYRCCFSIYLKLFVSAYSLTKNNIMQSIQGKLNTYRRSKVVGAFPNQESVLRLAVSILIDINEDWITGNRYLVMKQ